MLGRTKEEAIKDEEKKIKERDDGAKGMYVRSEQVETEYDGEGREKHEYERNIVIGKLEKGENPKGVDGDMNMQHEYKIIALGDKTEGDNREGCFDEKGKADDDDKEENANKNIYDKRPKHGNHMSSSGKNRKRGELQRRKREGRVADGDARNKHLRKYVGEAKVGSVYKEKKDDGAEKGNRENGDNSSQHTDHHERVIEDEAQEKRKKNIVSVDISNRNADKDKTKHEEKNGICVERRNNVLGAGALSLPVKVPVTSLHFRPNDKTTYLLGTASGEVLLVGGLRTQFLFIILEDYEYSVQCQETGNYCYKKRILNQLAKCI